jgi:hypothetical protein
MTQEYWRSTQLSIARHFGQCKIGGHNYIIVNEQGKDIFQLSAEAEKAGREHAIEPGDPADLVRMDFVPFYRKLGRERFLNVLRDNRTADDKELKVIFNEIINEQEKDERD